MSISKNFVLRSAPGEGVVSTADLVTILPNFGNGCNMTTTITASRGTSFIIEHFSGGLGGGGFCFDKDDPNEGAGGGGGGRSAYITNGNNITLSSIVFSSNDSLSVFATISF